MKPNPFQYFDENLKKFNTDKKVEDIINDAFDKVMKKNNGIDNLTLCIEYTEIENKRMKISYSSVVKNERLKTMYISKSNIDLN